MGVARAWTQPAHSCLSHPEGGGPKLGRPAQAGGPGEATQGRGPWEAQGCLVEAGGGDVASAAPLA